MSSGRDPSCGRFSWWGLIDHCEFVGRILVDYREGAFAVGGEGESGARIEGVASTPSPIVGVAITLPVSALITTITLSSQPAKRRRFFDP